jgi:hypothetical protein
LFLYRPASSLAAAGFRQKNLPSFFVSSTSHFPPLSLVKPLEQFLPVTGSVHPEIQDETMALSDSEKDPFRAKTSHCNRCG